MENKRRIFRVVAPEHRWDVKKYKADVDELTEIYRRFIDNDRAKMELTTGPLAPPTFGQLHRESALLRFDETVAQDRLLAVRTEYMTTADGELWKQVVDPKQSGGAKIAAYGFFGGYFVWTVMAEDELIFKNSPNSPYHDFPEFKASNPSAAKVVLLRLGFEKFERMVSERMADGQADPKRLKEII